jgi:hypothetical protein
MKQSKPPGEKRVRGLKRAKVRTCSIWERFARLQGVIDRSKVRTTEGVAAEGRINIDGEAERTLLEELKAIDYPLAKYRKRLLKSSPKLPFLQSRARKLISDNKKLELAGERPRKLMTATAGHYHIPMICIMSSYPT